MKSGKKFSQRGAGALAVSMLLLFSTSLVIFYLNRGLIFEQRTSANQLRATTAREVAEAGLEWATGMLNTPYTIKSDCTLDTTTTNNFRTTYVQTQLNAASPSADLAPITTIYPGCSINGDNTLTCNCPTSSNSVASLSSTKPKFTVQFLTNDASSVKVRATGCLATSLTCSANDSASTAGADATAVVEVILKLRPVIRAVPAAPLSAGGTVNLSGSFNIVNTDLSTNGILVNAGSTIAQGNGVSLTSIPGVPTANALVGSDSSLSTLATADPTCSNSTVFKAYFGSTIEQYMAEPTTKTISCSSTSNCESQLMNAYDDGWRSFYFSSDLQLSGNHTIGSDIQPVTIVTPNAITINGNWNVYGLLYSNSADWNDLGTGSAHIYGAEITCNDTRINGNGTVSYDASALKNLGKINADLVRVPGSWRDQ